MNCSYGCRSGSQDGHYQSQRAPDGHARAAIAAWTADHNTQRRHSAMDCQNPG